MSQRHSIQNGAVMLITTVTLNRTPIFDDSCRAREAVECLYRVQQYHPFFLYGFGIMPDHCHFLLRVVEPETISKIMNVYKSGMTFNLAMRNLWQQGFHMRIIKDASSALKYIHRNPVKKTLTSFAEEYPWSSASGKWDVAELECY